MAKEWFDNWKTAFDNALKSGANIDGNALVPPAKTWRKEGHGNRSPERSQFRKKDLRFEKRERGQSGRR